MASVPALAETVTVPGVAPVAGVAVNQVPLLSAAASTLKLMALGAPATLMVCDAGAAPPATWVKLSEAGVAEMVPALTLKMTGIEMGVSATAAPPAPVAVMVIVPV